jgi:hypothetical protein
MDITKVNKKGQTGAALITLIPFFLLILLGGTATIKFLLMDKTPYIILGIIILLILFRQKRREGKI